MCCVDDNDEKAGIVWVLIPRGQRLYFDVACLCLSVFLNHFVLFLSVVFTIVTKRKSWDCVGVDYVLYIDIYSLIMFYKYICCVDDNNKARIVWVLIPMGQRLSCD